MAIYHLSAKIVKRSDGRSATAAAAYRAGTSIPDERTGLVFDYTRRRGVIYAEILAPPDAPAPLLNRALLWNTVEAVERRRDAQVAREIELALPHEITPRAQLDLVRGFVQREFVARGMIADLCVHRADHRGDPRNRHAHVMLTLRPLAGDSFGPKARDWNETELLEHWRAAWADAVNQALARHRHAARVDHRSYADQGLALEAEPKMGPVATEMERRGRRSHAGDDRRAVQTRNRRRRKAVATLAKINVELDAIDAVCSAVATAALSGTSGGPVPFTPQSSTGDEPIPPRPQRSVFRRPAAWTRYLFAMWTLVAHTVTSPFRRVASLVTRRKRSGPNP